MFTSVNAADALLGRVPDARRLAGVKIAAVGEATARGPVPLPPGVSDLVTRGRQRSRRPAWRSCRRRRSRVAARLFPRGRPREGRCCWDGLSAVGGGSVDPGRGLPDVPAYRHRGGKDATVGADAVSFHLLVHRDRIHRGLSVGPPLPPVVVCIGPVTARSAVEAGLTVDAVAGRPDIEGLVEALQSVL